MSVLHILRKGADAEAETVIRAQAEQGVRMKLAVLPGADAPDVATAYAVDGDAGWNALLELIFEADTTITW